MSLLAASALSLATAFCMCNTMSNPLYSMNQHEYRCHVIRLVLSAPLQLAFGEDNAEIERFHVAVVVSRHGCAAGAFGVTCKPGRTARSLSSAHGLAARLSRTGWLLSMLCLICMSSLCSSSDGLLPVAAYIADTAKAYQRKRPIPLRLLQLEEGTREKGKGEKDGQGNTRMKQQPQTDQPQPPFLYVGHAMQGCMGLKADLVKTCHPCVILNGCRAFRSIRQCFRDCGKLQLLHCFAGQANQ